MWKRKVSERESESICRTSIRNASHTDCTQRTLSMSCQYWVKLHPFISGEQSTETTHDYCINNRKQTSFSIQTLHSPVSTYEYFIFPFSFLDPRYISVEGWLSDWLNCIVPHFVGRPRKWILQQKQQKLKPQHVSRKIVFANNISVNIRLLATGGPLYVPLQRYRNYFPSKIAI